MVGFSNIRLGFALDMSISCCLFPFLPAVLPKANAVSGVILALKKQCLLLTFSHTLVCVLCEYGAQSSPILKGDTNSDPFFKGVVFSMT